MCSDGAQSGGGCGWGREFSLSTCSQEGQSKQDVTLKGFPKSEFKQWKSKAQLHQRTSKSTVGSRTRWHLVSLSVFHLQLCTAPGSPSFSLAWQLQIFILFHSYQEPYFGMLSSGTQDAGIIILSACMRMQGPKGLLRTILTHVTGIPALGFSLSAPIGFSFMSSFLSPFLSPTTCTLGLLSSSYRISSLAFLMGKLN